MKFQIQNNILTGTFSIIVLIVILSITENVSYAQDATIQDLAANQVSASELKQEVIDSFGKGRRSNPEYAKKRGLITTGLTPAFNKNVNCRGIDEYWAMDYTQKRGREAYHGGIDIPAPEGTPILAAADGVVAGKFMNKRNAKGIEIMLRHSPEDSGHDMWVYTQYTHLLEMPELDIGQRVRMGEVIGKTSNSGISGKEAKERHGKGRKKKNRMGGSGKRRHALHFGAFYSSSPKYMINNKHIVQVDAYWMDPNALYRKSPPFDSASLKALPQDQKQVAIPYILPGGEFVPADTKMIWPYSCSRK